MRNTILVMLIVCMLLLAGCQPLVTSEKESISIYATFFPIYTLTDALMTGVPDATLHCLVQPQDGCLRDYTISDWDAYLLASADVVICGGRGLESFESLLFQWGDAGPAVSAVLYNLDLYQGKVKSDREDSHLGGPNPHIYMSVDGAKQMIEGISGALMALDPGYADRYLGNEAKAEEMLDELAIDMREAAGDIAGQSIILMNEALVYTANDLGLEIATWIERDSGEALYDEQLEACMDQLNASGARVVLLEQQAPISLVQALEDAGYAVARLDILASHREGEGFQAYIDAQLNNARAIGRAFEEINS